MATLELSKVWRRSDSLGQASKAQMHVFSCRSGQGRPNIAGASTASRHDVEIPGLTGAWTAQL